MTAVASPPSDATAATRSGRRLVVSEMWTSLAIAVIWIVVLAVALFGPDIVSSSPGSYARVPSAVVVALFAWLATWVIARHAFRDRRDDAP
jgi:ABC-type nickel/cobalt efflux system permease component RcnA